MKVLLYTEHESLLKKSGLGKAIEHQIKALDFAGVEYTLNKDDDYDILHINTYFPQSYFIAKRAKKNGKKIVYHAHSTEEDYKNGFIFSNITSKIFKKWLIKCYSLGDVILTPTIYSKRLLYKYKGLENKRIFDISNGIELNFFENDASLREKFRRRFSYKETDKIVFGIGLYIERKGILDFVELAKRLPQYKFIWFGYSPLIFAGRRVRQAIRTQLDNLTFAGYVEPEVIKQAMNGADLYLFPTFEETEGIPIIEACACKKSAIIRDIPVFDEWLVDGKNVYKAKNIDEFESKIKLFFEGKLKDVSEKSYEVARQRDLKIIGEKLKKIYESLI